MTDLCSQYRKIPDSKYHLFIKRFYKGFLNLSLWEVRYMSNRLFRARRTVFSVLILFAFMLSFVAAIPGVSYASPPIVRYDYAPGKYSDNGPYSYSTYQLPGWLMELQFIIHGCQCSVFRHSILPALYGNSNHVQGLAFSPHGIVLVPWIPAAL